MASCVYSIATSDAQAVRIANRLKSSGFTPSDISILAPDRSGVRELGHEIRPRPRRGPPLALARAPFSAARWAGSPASVRSPYPASAL